jgi:uncharacterized protein YndB with AHSA1/START domain
MKHERKWLFLAFVVFLFPVARAEVRQTAESSFLLEGHALVEASPARVYANLVDVASWWDPAHTWSGAAPNLKLDARAGGCFCERLPAGGSVEHARVVMTQPGVLLRLVGALGPLQESAVTGVLTFKLAPEADGTRITLSYAVSGALSLPAAQLAPLVDQVLMGQLERLGKFANQAGSR